MISCKICGYRNRCKLKQYKKKCCDLFWLNPDEYKQKEKNNDT